MAVDGQRHCLVALNRKYTRYPFYRRLSGPQGRSGHLRNIPPPPGFDTRATQPIASRCTDSYPDPHLKNVDNFSKKDLILKFRLLSQCKYNDYFGQYKVSKMLALKNVLFLDKNKHYC